jgi:D-arginine dehydrogenase
VLEQEAQLGYHASGRSASVFSLSYGGDTVRKLTRASRAFFETPPEQFADHPLVHPRGVLYVAREDQSGAMWLLRERKEGFRFEQWSQGQVQARVPVLKRNIVEGLYEPDVLGIDAAELLAGFARGIRRNHGEVCTSAQVARIDRTSAGWTVHHAKGKSASAVVVNAAGAWGDKIAELARLAPIGLQPRRRTAVTFSNDAVADDWPMVVDCDQTFYFKPDAGCVLASPVNEDPMPPCDVQPEELDIATIAHRIEEATTMSVGRIRSAWAGLRTFSPDGSIVIGPDPAEKTFVWYCGQGGFGIQVAPAGGLLAAAMALGQGVPPALSDQGVTADEVSPRRFQTGGSESLR